MTPTKILIGQIAVVFAIVLAGIWFATQWAAAALGYQPELGVPWAIIGHVQRVELVQHLDDLARQWDAMRAAHLHLARRQRPDRCAGIDLVRVAAAGKGRG
jgi:type IV secretory pathway TraG/TraD family ATPase VirD4